MTIAGHKISKKVWITVVIVLIVAITGIIVYNVKAPQKMLIGGLYDGISIKQICSSSDKYDIRNLSDAEKSVAEASAVMIIGMSLTEKDVGIANLKITFPDVTEKVRKAASSISVGNQDQFSKLVLEKYDQKSLYQKFDSVYINVEIKFDQNTWLIVPDENLIKAITGNLKEEIQAAFQNQ